MSLATNPKTAIVFIFLKHKDCRTVEIDFIKLSKHVQ